MADITRGINRDNFDSIRGREVAIKMRDGPIYVGRVSGTEPNTVIIYQDQSKGKLRIALDGIRDYDIRGQ